MSVWRGYVFYALRSRMFLWAFGLGVVSLGAGLGFQLSRQEAPRSALLGERVLALAGLAAVDKDDTPMVIAAVAKNGTPPKVLEALADELQAQKMPFKDLIEAVPVLAPYFEAKGDVAALDIFRQHYPEAEAALAAAFLTAWRGDAPATERISVAGSATPSPRFVRYVQGRLAFHHESYRQAYQFFLQDTDPDTRYASRYYVTRALAEERDFTELAKLERQPEYAPFFDTHLRLKVAMGCKDWPAIFRTVPQTQLESYREPIFFVAVLTGLAWGLVLAVLGDVPGLFSSRALLCVLALLAGAISTTPTIYLVILTEDILKLAMGDNIVHQLAFYIGGVGAREELCKLLLFVPFLPVLYKRDDDFEALIVASFVGLGFAMEENGSYFMLSEAAAAPGRFLSANFFHVALTGMNGLALYRVCTHGWRGLNQLLFVFPISILAHGGYDALLASDLVDSGSYWAMGVYVVYARYYLQTVHELRAPGRRLLSLTGTLVVGMSIVAAATLAFQMSSLGAMAGITLMGSELLGSVVLLFLFFHEFNETLTD